VRPLTIALVFAIGASALGCGEKKAGEGGGGGGGGAADSGGTGTRITKFRFGTGVDSNGVVINETESFRPGESVCVSFEVKNVPAKSQVKAVWNDSSKKKVSEEQKPPGSGSGAASFQLKGGPGVPEGDYVVEFFYGDPDPAPGKWTFLGTKAFHVGPKRTP
jgi:hypothetical protein